MDEADARVVERDDTLPDCGLERRRARASRSPWAAATSSTVGRASAATWRSTSTRLAGKPGEATAEQLAAGSPARAAPEPAAGLVPVRANSRPSSSAKNGLPAVASCTRASSGRVSSSPSRSRADRCSAPTLSGPSENRPSRSRGKERSNWERGAMSGPCAERRQHADRLLAQAPERDLEHAGGGRIEPLDVVEADEDRARARRGRAARRGRQARSRAHPELLAGLGEQQRDLERMPARRREREAPSRRGRAPAAPRARRTRAGPRPRRRGTSRTRLECCARPARRPPPRGSSCRCPPRPRARGRRALVELGQECLDRVEFLLACDDGAAACMPRGNCERVSRGS